MDRRLVLGGLLLAASACAGCGSSGPFDYVPVEGTVTYEDGTALPVDQFLLQFVSQAPAKETAFPRPATAIVDGSGAFDAVTSYKYGDGLIPGKHKVAVLDATGTNGQLLVPREYTNIATTPLMIDTNDAPLAIKIPQPARSRKR